MDSDLSHDPSALPSLISAVENGADLAIGSRYVPGGQHPGMAQVPRVSEPWREPLRRGDARTRRSATPRRGSAATQRRCWPGSISIASRADGYGFQIEMAYGVARRGGRIVEVPISFTDRVRGTSKMSGRIVIEALGLVTWWAIRDRILRRHEHADESS